MKFFIGFIIIFLSPNCFCHPRRFFPIYDLKQRLAADLLKNRQYHIEDNLFAKKMNWENPAEDDKVENIFRKQDSNRDRDLMKILFNKERHGRATRNPKKVFEEPASGVIKDKNSYICKMEPFNTCYRVSKNGSFLPLVERRPMRLLRVY